MCGLAIVFTDLENPTLPYRTTGNAPAFGLVLSSAARNDPKVAAQPEADRHALIVRAENVRLKGFGETRFEVWRVS